MPRRYPQDVLIRERIQPSHAIRGRRVGRGRWDISPTCPVCRGVAKLGAVAAGRLCWTHSAMAREWERARSWNAEVYRARARELLIKEASATKSERNRFVDALRVALRKRGWAGNIAKSSAKFMVAELSAGKGKQFTDEQRQLLTDLGLEPTLTRCLIPMAAMDHIAKELGL